MSTDFFDNAFESRPAKYVGRKVNEPGVVGDLFSLSIVLLFVVALPVVLSIVMFVWLAHALKEVALGTREGFGLLVSNFKKHGLTF